MTSEDRAASVLLAKTVFGMHSLSDLERSHGLEGLHRLAGDVIRLNAEVENLLAVVSACGEETRRLRTFLEIREGFGHSAGEARDPGSDAKPWTQVPDQNKRLMIAVCEAILSEMEGDRRQADSTAPKLGETTPRSDSTPDAAADTRPQSGPCSSPPVPATSAPTVASSSRAAEAVRRAVGRGRA